MLSFEDLLLPYGFAPGASTKLFRHMDSRIDAARLFRENRPAFDAYQSYQSGAVLRKADTMVAFTGRGEQQAVFVGVFRVLGEHQPGVVPMDPALLPFDHSQSYFYELAELPGFDDLVDRLVVDWGSATRMWHQWFRPKEKLVVELLPRGYVKEFPGFLNVVLTYRELVDVVKHPTANREWHRRLASVAGVYLVLDTKTGKQYVGSASGEGGLLGRWSSYALNGHAGNKQLQVLAEEDRTSIYNLQFSVLQTVDRSLSRAEVLALEQLHKVKLGSRAHGLNGN